MQYLVSILFKQTLGIWQTILIGSLSILLLEGRRVSVPKTSALTARDMNTRPRHAQKIPRLGAKNRRSCFQRRKPVAVEDEIQVISDRKSTRLNSSHWE